MSDSWIIWLDRGSDAAQDLLGGKAWHLAAMARAGFPVPPGFCLTTAAYGAYVEHNQILAFPGSPREIRDRLKRGTFPTGLAATVINAYRKMGRGRVAVRSSATAEDLAEASFAGQQSTVLNVDGESDLRDALRVCWASLWSETAASYRERRLAPPHTGPSVPEPPAAKIPIAMAIVVQRMVACDIAGVAFSFDPVSGQETLVIEAAPGLGENVVGGMAEVERYRVDRRERRVRGPRAGGILSQAQVCQIADTIMRLERLFDHPQDVEWGIQAGQFYVLQARPITVSPRSFFTDVIPGDEDWWTSGFLNERFSQPVSPLGWTLIRDLLEPLAFLDPLRFLGYHWPDDQPVTKLYRGHPFVSVRVFQVLYKPLPEGLLPEDARRYFPNGDTQLRQKAPYPRAGFDLRWLGYLLWHLSADPANGSPFANFRTWEALTVEYDEALGLLQDGLARLDENASLARAARLMREAQDLNARLLAIHRWSLMHADLFYTALRRCLVRWLGREQGTTLGARMVSGLANQSIELNQALGRIRSAADWRLFLHQYGHRSFCLDIYHPTFAEAPEQARSMLRGARVADTEALAAERRKAEFEAARLVGQRPGGWWRWRVCEWLLHHARRYMPLRENQRFYWQKGLAVQRKIALWMGRRMKHQRWMADEGDVFFLSWNELWGAVSGHAPDPQLVARRKADYHRLLRESDQVGAHDYPEFLKGNRPWTGSTAPAEGVWQGQPVSPGRAQGPARVVLNPRQFDRIQPGDILVTRGADPGWTPVFGRLSGLVLEVGGQLSHGAVVAREYGLAAVASIPGITRSLQDGEVIWVDGYEGTVGKVQALRNDSDEPRINTDETRI